VVASLEWRWFEKRRRHGDGGSRQSGLTLESFMDLPDYRRAVGPLEELEFAMQLVE
jgi:hypothetical protein